MTIDFNKYPLPKKRIRHHVSPNAYFAASDQKVLTDAYPPLIESIVWSEHFDNKKAPDVMDIGCGRGSFLMHYALEHPETNILGIEIRPLCVEWIEGVIEGEKIGNCSVVRYSVANGLPFIEDNTIQKVFYLFPDPWTKTRYQKRRAFNAQFLSTIYDKFMIGGELYLATDVPEVHEHHIEELENFGKLSYKIVQSDDEWKLPITNKEKFCRKENIAFQRIICTKLA